MLHNTHNNLCGNVLILYLFRTENLVMCPSVRAIWMGGITEGTLFILKIMGNIELPMGFPFGVLWNGHKSNVLTWLPLPLGTGG